MVCFTDRKIRMIMNDMEEETQSLGYAPLKIEELSQNLQEACFSANWKTLMPVQAHSLPYTLKGYDVMVQSQTGSGKTGAFLLPCLKNIDAEKNVCQALILVPTRELALQVEHEAKILFRGTLSCLCLYGGTKYSKQLQALQNGVQVVIGTPGRVLDHLLRRSLNLSLLKTLVFDEADRMLSVGFYQDMQEIRRFVPSQNVQVALFSATYPPDVLNISKSFLHEPKIISLSQGEVHVAKTSHYFCECSPMDKDRCLTRILEKENPSQAIIFCNTKNNVHYIAGVLQGFGYNASEFSADLPQNKREQVLEKLRSGSLQYLVATDVASRGIDIPHLSHVFLYEVPEDREAYIHRAGRTGRAGAAGTVISLVDIMEKLELERLAKFYKIDMLPYPDPSNEEIAQLVSERMANHLNKLRRGRTGLELERAKRFIPLLKDLAHDFDDIENIQLLTMLFDKEYQQSLSDKREEKPVIQNTKRKFYKRNKKETTRTKG